MIIMTAILSISALLGTAIAVDDLQAGFKG